MLFLSTTYRKLLQHPYFHYFSLCSSTYLQQVSTANITTVFFLTFSHSKLSHSLQLLPLRYLPCPVILKPPPLNSPPSNLSTINPLFIHLLITHSAPLALHHLLPKSRLSRLAHTTAMPRNYCLSDIHILI